VGAVCSMRTDMTNLIVLRSCANAPKSDNTIVVHSLVKVTTRIHNKGQGQLIFHHAMKAQRAADVQLHSLLTSKPDEDEWSTAGSGSSTHAKEPRHPLNRGDGPQYRSEGFGPDRTRTTDCPARSLVTTLSYLVS
jgi:hypothetical protein